MWRCCKKNDATVEFLDLCMDGMFEEVYDLYHKRDHEEECKEYQVSLLTSKDEHSLRTCLHLVSNKLFIFQVAFYGHEELCRFILDQYKLHNLDVDPRDCLDFTPLLSGTTTIFYYSLLACFRGYDQNEEEAKTSRIIIVRDLIECGADFNYQK